MYNQQQTELPPSSLKIDPENTDDTHSKGSLTVHLKVFLTWLTLILLFPIIILYTNI